MLESNGGQCYPTRLHHRLFTVVYYHPPASPAHGKMDVHPGHGKHCKHQVLVMAQTSHLSACIFGIQHAHATTAGDDIITNEHVGTHYTQATYHICADLNAGQDRGPICAILQLQHQQLTVKSHHGCGLRCHYPNTMLGDKMLRD